MRFGTVSIVGRTNVGKSTFLNAVLGEPLAIVSSLPQTTRDTLLGIVNLGDAQIAFMDTPGLHRPRSELGRRMNATAIDSLRQTDLVVFMTDVGTTQMGTSLEQAPVINGDDERLLAALPKDTPAILAINKVDLLRDKRKLLPRISAFQERHPFSAMIPLSAKSGDGVERVLQEIVMQLPEGKEAYDSDTITDRPLTFFVREYIREQVLKHTRREVPHAVAITIDRFVEPEPGKAKAVSQISATIHVEKEGQKGIILGQRGALIKQIGIDSRARIEPLIGNQVHLELFVRVTDRWKDVPRQLSELGYENSHGRSLSNLLPPRPKKPKAKTKAKKKVVAKSAPTKAPRPKSHAAQNAQRNKAGQLRAKTATKRPKSNRHTNNRPKGARA